MLPCASALGDRCIDPCTEAEATLSTFGAYGLLAKELDLKMSPADPGVMTSVVHLSGRVGGRRVAIERVVAQIPIVTFTAFMEPALDLGLAIRPSNVVESLKNLVGTVDVEVGDEDFDDAFVIRADEPARAKQLVTAPVRAALRPLQDALVAARDGEVTTRLTLGSFTLPDKDVDWLRARLLGVVHAADALAHAGTTTAPAREIAALGAPLAAFASEAGLASALGAPMQLSGTLAGQPTWVASRRVDAGRYEIEVAVLSSRPPGFHFVVSTAKTGIGTWLIDKDVELGHTELDATFDVRTEDAERLRRLLDDASATELVSLGKGRRLELDRFGVRLRDDGARFDPKALPAIIERLARLVAALERNDRLGPGAMYR